MSTAVQTEPRFFSYAEASVFTGLSEISLRRAVERGELRVYRRGRRCLFDRDELSAFVRGEGQPEA
jgi:excisionase family DNA binding protein